MSVVVQVLDAGEYNGSHALYVPCLVVIGGKADEGQLHSKQLRSIKMLIDSNHGIYRGENPAPGEDVHGELDRTPGIRERPRPIPEVAA